MTLFLLASAAHAVELSRSPAELCRLSSRVVVAEVTSAETYWGDDGLIRTHTWLHVLADLKPSNGARPADVELDRAGGRIGGLALRPPGPSFDLDHAFVLHLTTDPTGATILTSLQGVTPLGVAPDAATLQALTTQLNEVCHAR